MQEPVNGKKAMAFGEILRRTCSARQAADYAQCSIDTIYRWVAERKLEAHRPVARGSSRLRVNVESLRRLMGEAVE